MKRLLALLILAALVLAGCGGTVAVRSAFDPGGTVTTSGTVSIVRLTFTSDDQGNTIQVTVVTLLQSGTAQTLNFCGSQVSQFPMDTMVTAKFVPGGSCATLVSVASN